MRHTIFLLLLSAVLPTSGCSDGVKASPFADTGPQVAAADAGVRDGEVDGDDDGEDVEQGTSPDAGAGELWLESCPLSEPEFRVLDVDGVKLHVACQGEGPTIVLLHGFPEFWFSWKKVLDLLAVDHRVIAPDQRGYNLSDKPEEVSEYGLLKLVDDIGALIPIVSQEPVTVVGHDWGGPVAWTVPFVYPELVHTLVVLNGPHPNVLVNLLENDPAQRDAAQYMDFFRQEGSEEFLMANNFSALAGLFEGVLTDDELATYKEAWAQPGAIKGGLNWYRANDLSVESIPFEVRVEVPTLVMWGMDDTALLPQNLDGLDAYVPDLTVQRYEGVSHWIEHEIPETVAAEIRAFVAAHRGD